MHFLQVSRPSCQTHEYLIGKSIQKFGSGSPKEIDILRLYANFVKVPESIKMAKIIEEVNKYYTQRKIRTKNSETVRIKIKRLVSSFKNLLAKRKVKSMKERERQELFVENIHRCFNVALESSEQMDNDGFSSSDE